MTANENKQRGNDNNKERPDETNRPIMQNCTREKHLRALIRTCAHLLYGERARARVFSHLRAHFNGE